MVHWKRKGMWRCEPSVTWFEPGDSGGFYESGNDDQASGIGRNFLTSLETITFWKRPSFQRPVTQYLNSDLGHPTLEIPRSHTHTHTRTHKHVRNPLDEWSAQFRDLYWTTHNSHNTHISMPAEGFEPTTPASEQSQTHALDRTATATGLKNY